MAIAVTETALIVQRRHELNRAYDAVQTAAERLELAGLDDEASALHTTRRRVYSELLRLPELSDERRTTPSFG